ncbi:hypothetical protein [Gordonia terrae]
MTQDWTIGDGTYELVMPKSDPVLGTWQWQNGKVTTSVNGYEAAVGGVPEILTDAAELDWQWITETGSGPQKLTVPARWDSSAQALTLRVVGNTDIPFDVVATRKT